MKKNNLNQRSAAYTAPSVRVVNVNMRHAILVVSGETDDDEDVG